MKALDMNFEGDAFISYAHLDNIELVQGRKGWVANLHRALEVRVGQLLGKQPQIWRDPKLAGNDFFAETLIERLQRVAALITVISPRYVKSEWTRRELAEFWKAAERQGNLRLGERGRIFKILKTPVPLEQHPPELQSLLGYEFFRIDPETGKVRELDEIFGPEAQKEFWIKLDDLAHDICNLLEVVEAPQAAAPSTKTSATVFLAETTSDLREQREAIKRDLQQHGHTVLPSRTLPFVASELQDALRDDLAKCELSIHLVGKNYSLVPEGSATSLVEIQNEMAIARAQEGHFGRLLWIPAGLHIEDERQKKVLASLRSDPRLQISADLLESSIEELKTVYHDRLKRKPPEESGGTAANTALAGDRCQVYVIYDQRDSDVTSVWTDFLFKQGFEILRPVFEGDEEEIREYHQENLASCDAVLIIYGKAGELWLRRKLREIQKSAGYGRTKPAPLVGIWLLPPSTPEKETFRTHEAIVIPQVDAVSPDSLLPFVARLRT